MHESHLRSFRIQASPKRVASVAKLLQEEGFRFTEEPFSPYCYRLLAEPTPLGASLAAFFGYIYIQDRSSMLPPLALKPTSGERILDMCASPGSKTSFLSLLLEGSGAVLANEPNPARNATLRANLLRLDSVNIMTCSYEGQKIPLPANFFDAIQLDPPCSGWGTSKKNPKVLELWQGNKVDSLIALQRKLLQRAAELVKPGGRILYSTCTTNTKENEEQVLFAENKLGLKRKPLSSFDGFVFDQAKDGEGTLRVNEEGSNAQGFYLALLEKHEDVCLVEADKELPPAKEQPFAEITLDSYSGIHTERLPEGRTIDINGTIYFLSEPHGQRLPSTLRYTGAQLGTLHAGRFLPTPRRRILAPDTPREGLDLQLDCKAIRNLLSGQTIKADRNNKEGLLFWEDLPLGWIQYKNGRVIANFR